MKIARIALLLLCLAVPARADDGPTPAEIAAKEAAHKSALGLVDLFDTTCIAYMGRLPHLRIWLDAHVIQANEHQTAYFLGTGGAIPGKVWIERNKAGNYAIVVGDGLCDVKAEKGMVSDVADYFQKQAAPKLKLTLKPTGDADGTALGVTGRVITYGLESEGEGYAITIVGHDKHDIPLQSQISLTQAK
jgi:hypothetical protein